MRKRMLERRDALPENVRARKSAEVCRRLESMLAARLGDGPAPTVAAFASMGSEIDTRAFVRAAQARGWNVCFPCMVRDADDLMSHMAFYRVEGGQMAQARAGFLDAPLRRHARGTLERIGFRPVEPDELDAVVVPLVAFDDAGRRLGYGGGNYDRLLACLREDAAAVGAGFEEQRVESVPCEPHDIPLPRIVSA